MMSLVPKSALQFKGISNFSDLLSVLGFYSANNIIYMMLLGSIYAIVLSSNILMKEEYGKTAEYLLAWPVTRSEVFITKLAVVTVNILLLNIVTALAGFICLELVKKEPYSFSAFLILSFYTLMLNLLFCSIGFFLSAMVKKPKPVTTFSIGLVLIFYFIYTLSKITEGAYGIGYLSPFRYTDVNAIDPAYKLDIWNLLYFTFLSLLLTGISYRLYRKRDIYT
jgi:ABC-2 type transport system permease protein